jgi:hypothetical protein
LDKIFLLSINSIKEGIMTKQSLGLFLALVAMVVFTASCGSDSGGTAPESTTSLTDAEAEAVAEVVAESISGVGSTLESAGEAKLGVSLATVETTIDETINCDESGTVGLSGTSTVDVDESASTVETDYTITETFDECAQTTEDSGTVTLDGTLTNTGTADFDFADLESFSGSISSTTTGTIAVTGVEAGSGDCGVLVTVDATFDSDNLTITIEGSICGNTISISESEPFDTE